MKKVLIFLVSISISSCLQAQSWVDSVELHGRQVFMPAASYKWDWGQATFLNSLVHLYYSKSGEAKKPYLDYVKTAMDATYHVANGKHPNAVASAHGMAFLARVTGENKYLDKANEIYADFLKIPQSPNGGASHRAETIELWDDTVYMLSMFLLEMYRLTGDEKYLADFTKQFIAHDEKLTDEKTGLWVHGWDADDQDYDDGCSIKGWPDKQTRRNHQIWARGNGWVGMALVDALSVMPKKSRFRKPLEQGLKQYVEALAPLQNRNTGHWYQLVTLPDLPKNFEESSCTAMFAYTMIRGVELKLLDAKKYLPLVEQSYKGLRAYSMISGSDGYLIPSRVSGGTCVGDEAYYLTRKITQGTGFGYGSFIMFGLAYERFHGLRK